MALLYMRFPLERVKGLQHMPPLHFPARASFNVTGVVLLLERRVCTPYNSCCKPNTAVVAPIWCMTVV